MANLMIYENSAGGWTLVEVPTDRRDGSFYSVPHSRDRYFNTKDEAMKALRALRPERRDDEVA